MSRSTVLVSSVPCPFFTDVGGWPCHDPAPGDRSANELQVPGFEDVAKQVTMDNVEQVLVENPIVTTKPEDEFDAMRVVLSLNRNTDAVHDHSLLADLSLLESVITPDVHSTAVVGMWRHPHRF
jgi:hypothetical protein